MVRKRRFWESGWGCWREEEEGGMVWMGLFWYGTFAFGPLLLLLFACGGGCWCLGGGAAVSGICASFSIRL